MEREQPAGPAMTLGNMRALGVTRLIASCLNDACRHTALIDVFLEAIRPKNPRVPVLPQPPKRTWPPSLPSPLRGGYHLVDVSDAEVTEMVMRFRDKWRIERMAAGHCTGQFAFAELVRIYGVSFTLVLEQASPCHHDARLHPGEASRATNCPPHAAISPPGTSQT